LLHGLDQLVFKGGAVPARLGPGAPVVARERPAAVPRRGVLLSLLSAAVLGGCARTERRPGEIVVGSSPTGVPFSFVDPWTNELTGSMIDAARSVVGAVSLQPSFAIVPFAALIPSLLARKIDMISAAMVRTPEREKVVAFSEPVLPYPAGLVVRSGDRGLYPDLGALRDRRVGVQFGTRFVEQLQAAGVREVVTYDGPADILREVSLGRLQAGYGDEPIFRYQLRVGPKRDARLVGEFRAPSLEYLCFVLRREDPVIPILNAEIERVRPRLSREIADRWHLGEGA
jgi:polar amino acid transport system substrate-binding protein